MIQFIGRELKRVCLAKGGKPVKFEWDGEMVIVEKILKQWHDFDYSSISPKKNWRSRRHRNYFKVLTRSGRCFELYCDRGTKLDSIRHWVLSREMS